MIVPGPQIAFSTPPHARAWQRWACYSPLARLLAFVIVFAACVKLSGLAMGATGWPPQAGAPLQASFGRMLAGVVPAIVAYLVLARAIERRRPLELLSRKAPSHALAGIAAGTLLFSSVVGTLWLLDVYHVVGFDPETDWVTPLLLAGIGAAVTEEIMFRGVLFRMLEEGLGTWVALLASALFFGFAHMNNPGATAWSSMAIAMEAGLLFGLLYNVTRSLPLCMGLHAAWNFCQGTVYGIPVSGTKADGWLVSTRTGPEWLSGGAFGAEASVVALALCSTCSLWLLCIALRNGTIVAPAWIRRRNAAAAAALPTQQPALASD